jgi:transcriptional regulator with XRE-family HTH domain
MLGDVVRETRIKRGLTQAKLARLAGVSRRHLAALEKGANVSILVLRKVASVLDLAEIQLGGLSLRAGDMGVRKGVNVAVVADAIREARVDARRTEAILAHAEGLLNGNAKGDVKKIIARFPRLALRYIDVPRGSGDILKERPEWLTIKTSGVVRQGEPVDEKKIDTILLPAPIIDKGEIVLRAAGDKLREQGIEDGDLLVVQLRKNGRAATGELAIGKIGTTVFIGRWWQKHGRKALLSDTMSEVTVGKSTKTLKIVGVINAIVRLNEG